MIVATCLSGPVHSTGGEEEVPQCFPRGAQPLVISLLRLNNPKLPHCHTLIIQTAPSQDLILQDTLSLPCQSAFTIVMIALIIFTWKGAWAWPPVNH